MCYGRVMLLSYTTLSIIQSMNYWIFYHLLLYIGTVHTLYLWGLKMKTHDFTSLSQLAWHLET